MYSFLFIFFVITPNNAQSDELGIKNWVNLNSKKSFSQIKTNQNNFLDNSFGFELSKNINNISLQLNFNANKNNKLKFDQTKISYEHNNLAFGIGKINRHWSFSPKTSLILSSNARPSDSIFINFSDQKKSDKLLFSWIGPWSFEAFNSTLSNSSGPKNSMLLGLRALIEPVSGLKFELLKTSQWGGNGYSKSISAFNAAVIGNTNDSINSNINQLAGFGFSYQPAKQILPFRIYGQFIGEDEAGGLPSCFMHLFGSEWSYPNIKFLTKFGVELTDTRINRSEHGNCGPNTAYNNAIYKYTNYGKSLGAPIDTEGQSVSLWGSMPFMSNISLDFAIERLIINDASWSNHRLSTDRKAGHLLSIGSSWELNSFKIQSSINYLDFSLNKGNIPRGLSLNLNTIHTF